MGNPAGAKDAANINHVDKPEQSDYRRDQQQQIPERSHIRDDVLEHMNSLVGLSPENREIDQEFSAVRRSLRLSASSAIECIRF